MVEEGKQKVAAVVAAIEVLPFLVTIVVMILVVLRSNVVEGGLSVVERSQVLLVK